MTQTTVVHISGHGDGLHDIPEFRTPDGRTVMLGGRDPREWEEIIEEFITADGRVVARDIRRRQDCFFACETSNGFEVLRGDQVPPDAIIHGAGFSFASAEAVFMSENFGD